MPADVTIESSKFWRTIVWTLRITVAVQCLGNWRWFAQIGETPFLAWLISPSDVGGLDWSEATGLAVQQTVGWLALVAGVCVLIRPCAPVLGPLLLLQLLIAIAMWRTDAGFTPQVSWLNPQWTALFPFATQAARIVAPLGLLILDPWRTSRPLSQRRIHLAMNILLWGTSLTFVAHGIEAWQHHPVFIDLLLGTDSYLLGLGLTQATAENLLSLIGILDLFVAVACLSTRSRGILWWMAFWGGITALSRVTAFGLVGSWHAAAIRMPHLGAPLAVVLFWHLLRWKRDGQSNQGESSAPVD